MVDELLFFMEVVVGGLLAGTMYSLVALGFVLIFKASECFLRSDPIALRSFDMTSISVRWGIFLKCRISLVNSEAAIRTKAEFLAPLTFIWPESPSLPLTVKNGKRIDRVFNPDTLCIH